MIAKTPSIVFVHGAGGLSPLDKWLSPLNVAMRELGYPEITAEASADGPSVVVLDYVKELLNVDERSATSTPAPVHEYPVHEYPVHEYPVHGAAPHERDRLAAEFAVRQSELRERATVHADPVRWAPSVVARRSWAAKLGFGFAMTRLELLRIYHTDALRRASAQRRVLSTLPRDRPLIIVAHSLGTVIVADILRRLPKGTNVELLVTLGSPLGAISIGGTKHGLADSFPHDRVKRWLNVYNAHDPATGFAGVSARLPAVDVHVAVGAPMHELSAYMRTKPVAEAIASVLFPTPSVPEKAHDPAARLARRIHPYWTAALVQTSFAANVSDALPSKAVKQKARIDAGLRLGAEDYARMIRQNRSIGNEDIDSPLADGRFPEARDLLGDGWRLIANSLSDRQLLPMTVTLLMQPLVPTYDIDVKDRKSRDRALEGSVGRLRRAGSPLRDCDYVKRVRESLTWSRDTVADSHFPLGAVLISAGLVVLAATGVGLAVAGPAAAGLVGAAAITSTLATFGPGGMIGGVAMLAALTGTGMAVASAGTVVAGRPGSVLAGTAGSMVGGAAGSMVAGDAFASRVENLSPDELKGAIIAVLAVVKAMCLLGDTPPQEPFGALCAVRDALQARNSLLAAISPDSRMRKACQQKIGIVERALAGLTDLFSASGLTSAVALTG